MVSNNTNYLFIYKIIIIINSFILLLLLIILLFLGKEAAIAIAQSLAYHNNVTYVNLGYNNFDFESSLLLSNIIVNNSTITTLILSGNNIGDEGLKYLSLEKFKFFH